MDLRRSSLLLIFLVQNCSSIKVNFSLASPEEFQPVAITQFIKREIIDTTGENKTSEYSWKAEAVEGAFTYGYRIQVIATSNKKQVEKLKEEVLRKGFNYPIYVKYVPPMYRLRIGDFKTQEEAQKALNQLKSAGYKDAFITEDFINK